MPSTSRDRGPSRLRRRWIVGVGGVGLLAGLIVPTANAVHDAGALELDGNAVSDTNDDWDRVCYEVAIEDGLSPALAAAKCTASSPTSSAGGASAVTWIAEPSLNSSIFTGGGSKDPQPIESWAWKDGAGGLPDKDNLLHAFAARYTVGARELLFYGADRYDNSGDAQIGFWFLQDEVTLGTNKIGGGTGFDGSHLPGDVAVISDFSNGGDKATISVYEWDPTCLKAGGSCADANLRILSSNENALCSNVPDDDAFCGEVNTTDGTVAPWAFLDKSGNNTYLTGEFFEAGIDLTFLELGDRCFASVAAETRSSTSTTATLKDFVLGKFGSCGSEVTTQAKDGAGANVTGNLSIGTTDSYVSVKDEATVTVTGISNWSGTVEFYLCGPEADVTECDDTTGTAIGSAVQVNQTTSTVLSDTAVVSSAGDYCWAAVFTSGTDGVPDGQDDGTNECFTVDPVTPTLATTAGADVLAGNPVTDTAVLTGYAYKPGTPVINPTTDGGKAGGTITFKLYGPGETPAERCALDAVYESAAIDVGDLTGAFAGERGAVATSGTITAPGVYSWVATYSGDSPNTNGKTHNTDCTDSNENVTVTKVQPTISTAQKWLPNDSATITAPASSGDLAGSLRFRLYDNETQCLAKGEGAELLYDSNDDGAITVSGPSPKTRSSANTSVFVEATATVWWLVQYDSTNPAQKNVTSNCIEQSILTIDNDTSD